MWKWVIFIETKYLHSRLFCIVCNSIQWLHTMLSQILLCYKIMFNFCPFPLRAITILSYLDCLTLWSISSLRKVVTCSNISYTLWLRCFSSLPNFSRTYRLELATNAHKTFSRKNISSYSFIYLLFIINTGLENQTLIFKPFHPYLHLFNLSTHHFLYN